MKKIRVEYDDQNCYLTKRTINYSGEVIISIRPKVMYCFVCNKAIKTSNDFNIVNKKVMQRIGNRIIEIIDGWKQAIVKYKLNEDDLDMSYRFKTFDADTGKNDILCCNYCSKNPEDWAGIRHILSLVKQKEEE